MMRFEKNLRNWVATLALLASFTLGASSIEHEQHEFDGRSAEKSREGGLTLAQKEVKEPTKPAQDIFENKSLMEAYGFSIPSEEQISLWRKERLRKEQAAMYLKKTGAAPISSQFVDAVIYLQDTVGWSNPSPNHIATTLNLMGLESYVIGQVKT